MPVQAGELVHHGAEGGVRGFQDGDEHAVLHEVVLDHVAEEDELGDAFVEEDAGHLPIVAGRVAVDA